MNKCLKCGKETKNEKFCSRKCCGQYIIKESYTIEKLKESNKDRKQLKESCEKIKATLLEMYEEKRKKLIETIPFEDLPKNLIKKIIREEKKNKCDLCNYEYTDPETGKGPFEIHHKDGNKNNWRKENLGWLCLNCHWKTGNYKFKNRRHSDKTKRLISENNYNRKKVEQISLPTFKGD